MYWIQCVPLFNEASHVTNMLSVMSMNVWSSRACLGIYMHINMYVLTACAALLFLFFHTCTHSWYLHDSCCGG